MKMKQGLTEVIVVLDKSGSMSAIKSDTIGGFNTFVEGQKKVPGEVKLTLALFDSRGNYDLKYNGIDISDIPELNDRNYVPGGMTALIDAMGRTIDDVGNRLAKTPDYLRPEKVIMVIITDGEENDSVEYTRDQVFSKIEHQTNIYKWEFMFLGANQDAIREAAKYGISSRNTLNYKADDVGIKSVFYAANKSISSYRTCGDIGNLQSNYDSAVESQTK